MAFHVNAQNLRCGSLRFRISVHLARFEGSNLQLGNLIAVGNHLIWPQGLEDDLDGDNQPLGSSKSGIFCMAYRYKYISHLQRRTG